jgi:hypothetical protein
MHDIVPPLGQPALREGSRNALARAREAMMPTTMPARPACARCGHECSRGELAQEWVGTHALYGMPDVPFFPDPQLLCRQCRKLEVDEVNRFARIVLIATIGMLAVIGLAISAAS